MPSADERFRTRLDETGARDPRPYYRTLLRELKGVDEDAYDEMVRRYRSEVTDPIEAGRGDPLELWLSFGLAVAARLHPGRPVTIAEDGRARTLETTPDYRQLVLHLPDEARTRAVPIAIPQEPSAAQSAALDLLVKGKTRLPESA